MTRGKSLYDYPVHLGRAGTATAEPKFTGFDWYQAYGGRNAADGPESRLVSLFRFDESWTSWEMHPSGEEIVCVVEGEMTLHQELADGTELSYELGPGEYAINPRGAWHTADANGPVVALFITAGEGTTNRARELLPLT
ncbi:MAG TPA: cupin domain-containing protein [Sphingomicrobium sp.]|nr:cupin domain-containing protein [Sphingomicrobium sp.]